MYHWEVLEWVVVVIFLNLFVSFILSRKTTVQNLPIKNSLFNFQIVGEVLKQLTEDKFIVKATNGPRYVVGCRRQLDKEKLKEYSIFRNFK